MKDYDVWQGSEMVRELQREMLEKESLQITVRNPKGEDPINIRRKPHYQEGELAIIYSGEWYKLKQVEVHKFEKETVRIFVV